MIEQRARGLIAGRGRHAPPAFKRRQPLRFGIGQAQPLRQPLGILLEEDAERAQPPRRIGLEPGRRLDFHHVLETRQQRHAAEHRAENARFRHDGERRRRVRREQKLQQFHAHALARQHFEPAARDDAGVQAGSVERARAVPGVKAKKTQDAQIIFGNPLVRIADETHAARRDVGNAAGIVVNRAVRPPPTAH